MHAWFLPDPRLDPLLPPERVADPALNHPSIITIYDISSGWMAEWKEPQ